MSDEQLTEPVETHTQGSDAAPAGDTAQQPDGGTMTGSEPATPDAGPDLGAIRQSLAGGDEGLMKQLERYTSLEEIGKGFKNAQDLARKKQELPTLPDDATDEQFAEFRKTLGLPDEPDAYPVDFGDDFEADEGDKALLGSFKEMLHKKAGDPRTASIAMEWYKDAVQQQKQDRAAVLAEREKETQAALRSEYGPEYDGNIAAASELMKSQMGAEKFDQMMDLRMEDGSRLQDHADFVKMMVNLGRDYYGSTAIIKGDVETTARTIDEKIKEFNYLRKVDETKYFSDEVQSEVAKLYVQKEKLAARK